MKILITNDDSIQAEQLLPLIRWCKQLGDVTTVVPQYEQSAKSHGIEIHKPFRVEQVQTDDGTVIYTVDSTPADCVRYAVLGMGLSFDLVISGINRGYNIGTDILYSGTVAAVREAGVLGIPAIALSTSLEYYGDAIQHLPEIFAYIRDNRLMEIHSAYNINIPPAPQGMRITRQGGVFYSDSFIEVEDGMYLANGICAYRADNNPTLDTETTLGGYISIMPVTIDMTAQDVYRQLTE